MGVSPCARAGTGDLPVSAGPLVCLVRQASLPGGQLPPGREIWVAQATPDWRLEHLE
jgi:hypothetical protein